MTGCAAGFAAAGFVTAALIAPAVHAQALPPPAAAAFAEGRAALAEADALAAAARLAILEAARLRRALLASRAAASPATAATADGDAATLERLQREGAEGRAGADAARARALRRFADGLAAAWPAQVRHTGPLAAAPIGEHGSAHNARVRSVHPNMPPPMPADNAPKDAPLGTPMATMPSPPEGLDLGTVQLSRTQRHLAHIEVEAPDAPDGVPLNRLHGWRFVVCDLDGRPLSGARIEVGGHMPGHVHGLPTQPRVTAETAPGVYRVEGMKFQMAGWWVMQFEIRPAGADDAAADNVAFNLAL